MMNYADDTIQGYFTSWWIKDKKNDYRRGRLIHALLPHVHQVPFILIPSGRGEEPTNHTKIRYTMKELKLLEKEDLPALPTAALSVPEGEKILAFRGKIRPALIISSGGKDISQNLIKDKPKWQTAPTILVVPYYGAERNGQRAGFKKEFVDRVKKAEYPNFYWDKLPISGDRTEGSICRLDYIFPLGKHHDSVKFTEHCLSKEAMTIIDEWLHWLIEDIEPSGNLQYVRKGLLEIEKI